MKVKTRAILIALMSAVMFAVTATGTASAADAEEDFQANSVLAIVDSENCYFEVPTPDNCTVDVYHGDHKFGEITWNDYYDDDHSRDVDNLYIGDRDGDGYYIRVCAMNGYTGQERCNSNADENVDTISFSDNVPAGYSVPFKVCIKKDGANVHCSVGYDDFWFDE